MFPKVLIYSVTLLIIFVVIFQAFYEKVNALNIEIEEISVKDLYYAAAIIGQGNNPDVNKAWQLATRMINIRRGLK